MCIGYLTMRRVTGNPPPPRTFERARERGGAKHLCQRFPQKNTAPMRRLLIATMNGHKTKEFRAILGPEWEVSDLTVYPGSVAPEETGSTFLENATIKALAASRVYDGLVLADDSGLEVDALGGAPGVFSARYAGPSATDAENRKKLLRELAASGTTNRRARFRCVLALARPGPLVESFQGVISGNIVARERGEGGFGYDPLFRPEGYAETFSELAAPVKNSVSHRGRAMAALRDRLLNGCSA